MNFDPDENLFGLDVDPFNCASPLNDGYDYRTADHMAEIGEDMSGMQYDNSLAVPMDDYQFANDMQNDSRDFQTLQPPVSSGYDMDMAHSSQSSMGMGYSNGGTTESQLYEQTTTITNGDHHMMGGGSGEDPYGMPSTSFASYHASPMAAADLHQSSPSVSRQTSRPASRTTIQKGGGQQQQHLSAPSTSSNYSTPQAAAPPPAKTPAKKSQARPPANGRKKNNQGAHSVGAVLAKAHKSAPAASMNTLRLTPEDAGRMAKLSLEIEQLERQETTPHTQARVRELTEQRAQILMSALTAQVPAVVALTPAQPTHTPRPQKSHKKQAPPPPPPPAAASSPGYTPQCAVQYGGSMPGPSGISHDGYGAVPGPSHGGYTVTPTAPPQMQQRGQHMYKVATTPSGLPQHAGPLRGNGVPPGGQPQIFVQQRQQQLIHGQPPPQMMHQMPSSSMTPSMTVAGPSGAPMPPMQMTSTPMMGGGVRKGPGGRQLMVRGGPNGQQHMQPPLPVAQLQQPVQMNNHHPPGAHPPGMTVGDALKQGALLQQRQHLNLQQLQNNNHHLQQQLPGPHQHHLPPQHQQQPQHRSSPMPSTSSAPHHHAQQHHHQPPPQQQQPQSLLQLSQPVPHHQPLQQQQLMDNNPFRRDPALIARRIAEKQAGRQRKLQNAFEIMSKQLLEPDTEVPFSGVDDVFKRLMPYHLLFEHDMDPQLEEEFDLQFMRSMVDADEKKRRLTDRMRRIAINEAVAKKDEECNLLLFLDAEWERRQLEEEKGYKEKGDIESLRPVIRQTALSLSDNPSLPPPSIRLAELKKPPGVISSASSLGSLYDYHPFVERRRIPTPPPPGPLHGLEESEVEEDTEDEEQEEAKPTISGPSHTGKSQASAHALLPTQIKREPEPSSPDENSVSPEMGWPVEQAPPNTVPLHRPTVTTIKQEIASPRPVTAAKVIKQEISSPARSKVTVAPSGYSKHGMPEAIPVPLAKRNRMMEEKMMEEERKKKVDEREKRAAEERRRGEDERKMRERRKKEEEARLEEERRERKEHEENERRKKEQEEPQRIVMPLKLKIKMAARAEDERKEEEKKEVVRKEVEKREEEEREKKSKKKRKKEKRRAEEEDDEERERKRRKKERKERERQQQATLEPVLPPAPATVLPAVTVTPVVATVVPASATSMTTPIPKLKIKFGGGGGGVTPAATPSAAAMSTPRPQQVTTMTTVTPVQQPSSAVRSLAPLVTPILPTTPLQQSQQQPTAPPTEPRIKIKFSLAGLNVATTPSPVKEKEKEKRERREGSKEERRREKKEERRRENGHGEKERHHHRHKEHNHKEHKEHKQDKSERRREREQQQQLAAAAVPAAAVQPRLSAVGAPPTLQREQQQQPRLSVPSVKINMAPRPQPVAPPPAPTAVAAPIPPKQQPQLIMQQPPPMMMSAHKLPLHQPQPHPLQPHSHIFRPSVISTPPSLPMAHLQQQHQQLLMPSLPLQTPSTTTIPQTPTLIPPLFLGLARLPPGPEEKSPEPVVFSDSEDEDEARSHSLRQSAAAINRMVGHPPSLLPQPHHHLPHRVPQLQPQPTAASFPWNNQYQ